MTDEYNANHPNQPAVMTAPQFTPQQISDWKAKNSDKVTSFQKVEEFQMGPSPMAQLRTRVNNMKASGQLVPVSSETSKQGYMINPN